MRQYMRVMYIGVEWSFIEEIKGKGYLLRSLNRNVNDVIANPKHVTKKKLKGNKDEK